MPIVPVHPSFRVMPVAAVAGSTSRSKRTLRMRRHHARQDGRSLTLAMFWLARIRRRVPVTKVFGNEVESKEVENREIHVFSSKEAH